LVANDREIQDYQKEHESKVLADRHDKALEKKRVEGEKERGRDPRLGSLQFFDDEIHQDTGDAREHDAAIPIQEIEIDTRIHVRRREKVVKPGQRDVIAKQEGNLEGRDAVSDDFKGDRCIEPGIPPLPITLRQNSKDKKHPNHKTS
jgi:hypothetical protein